MFKMSSEIIKGLKIITRKTTKKQFGTYYKHEQKSFSILTPKIQNLNYSLKTNLLNKKINNINSSLKAKSFDKSCFSKLLIKNAKNNFSEIINEKHQEDISQAKQVNIIFFYANGKKEVHAQAEIGKSVLDIAKKYDVDLEGACESSLACSTCHVILESEIYDIIPHAKEEEEDLLDLAFGLSHTSRLGCQVKITKDFEGLKITIPSATRNLDVSGAKAK